jgi:hypothetical protein
MNECDDVIGRKESDYERSSFFSLNRLRDGKEEFCRADLELEVFLKYTFVYFYTHTHTHTHTHTDTHRHTLFFSSVC